MIITIGGSIGSGKTTLAKEISRRFKLKHVSAGSMMRKMAKEKGMSLLDFSKYAESNPEIDREIDERQKSLVKTDCVVDGRLSAYLIPADLKIWLDAPLKDRVRRIVNRDNVPEKEARKGIIKREQSEKKRYLQIYDIHLASMEVYDLIINNGRFSIKNTADIVSAAVKGI